MSRSLTVPVPSSRRVLGAVGVIAAGIVLLFVGLWMGRAVLGPTVIMSVVVDGDLHEVHILGGAVYLGHIVSDDGGVIRLSGPALLRQEEAPAASAGQGGIRLVVQSLAVDPFAIAADVLIPTGQVTLIGVVAPTSSLSQAYGEAMGASGLPDPTPSP